MHVDREEAPAAWTRDWIFVGNLLKEPEMFIVDHNAQKQAGWRDNMLIRCVYI